MRYRKIPYSSIVGTGVLDEQAEARQPSIVIIVPPSSDQQQAERIAQICTDAMNEKFGPQT